MPGQGARPEVELIRRAYEAFNGRDLDAAIALMAPDVEWPNGMEGGVEHGREAVRAYWTRQWSVIDPHVEPTGVVQDESGRWVVDVHQVVRALDGSVLLDRPVQHVYELRDGLIARMTIVEDPRAGATPADGPEGSARPMGR